MNKIIHGDSLEVLKDFEDESVDLIPTDPPYGISFMNKGWDKVLPDKEIWRECYRVLKPGAWLFAMSASRLDVLSRMTTHLEEAGMDTSFTPIYWTYSSGMPKAHNLGKEDPELEGMYWGFNPKPAVEVIIVCMKPLKESSYLKQAQSNKKGSTWLDDCRTTGGRFPANLLVSDDVLDTGKSEGSPTTKAYEYEGDFGYQEGFIRGKPRGQAKCVHYGDSGTYSRLFSLDEWAERNLPFLIVKKANKEEKNMGLSEGNTHPTVKPIKLMSYLITMGSREDDLILDPFCGSGTTCIAAEMLNRKWIGIDIDKESCEIAEKRIKAWTTQGVLF